MVREELRILHIWMRRPVFLQIAGFDPDFHVRVASKGAFIARFASPAGDDLVSESGWIVP